MIPIPADLQETLTTSHAAAPVRVEAMWARQRLGLMSCSAASVSDDLTAFSRRSASLTVAATDEAKQWLSTPGVGIRVSIGAMVGGRARYYPVHWGTVYETQWSWRDGQIQFTSPDMLIRVTRARFTSPRASTHGSTIPLQIEELVRDVLPWAGVVNESPVAPAVTPVTWDQDRDAAIQDLAKSSGLEVLWRPTGDLVIRPIRSLISAPDVTVREGLNLSDAQDTVSTERMVNVVVATSDSSSGAGYSGISQDDDPNSPTFVGSEFGQNVDFYSSELLTSAAQCVQAAKGQRVLAQQKARTTQFTIPRDGRIESGDRMNGFYDHKLAAGVVQSVSLDCFATDMTITAGAATMTPLTDTSGLS